MGILVTFGASTSLQHHSCMLCFTAPELLLLAHRFCSHSFVHATRICHLLQAFLTANVPPPTHTHTHTNIRRPTSTTHTPSLTPHVRPLSPHTLQVMAKTSAAKAARLATLRNARADAIRKGVYEYGFLLVQLPKRLRMKDKMVQKLTAYVRCIFPFHHTITKKSVPPNSRATHAQRSHTQVTFANWWHR
jgi:hypothetical protein